MCVGAVFLAHTRRPYRSGRLRERRGAARCRRVVSHSAFHSRPPFPPSRCYVRCVSVYVSVCVSIDFSFVIYNVSVRCCLVCVLRSLPFVFQLAARQLFPSPLCMSLCLSVSPSTCDAERSCFLCRCVPSCVCVRDRLAASDDCSGVFHGDLTIVARSSLDNDRFVKLIDFFDSILVVPLCDVCSQPSLQYGACGEAQENVCAVIAVAIHGFCGPERVARLGGYSLVRVRGYGCGGKQDSLGEEWNWRWPPNRLSVEPFRRLFVGDVISVAKLSEEGTRYGALQIEESYLHVDYRSSQRSCRRSNPQAERSSLYLVSALSLHCPRLYPIHVRRRECDEPSLTR